MVDKRGSPLRTAHIVKNKINYYHLNHSCFAFQEFGEIMFGLSYLPTAQRVSFSILKATNLKFDEVVENVESFRKFLFLRRLLK